jgi:drug/metabolite transporter (DMT)-like permease
MNQLVGFLLIGVSAASFGTLALWGRYAYAAGMDTFTILCLRFSFSAVVMAGLMVARREALPRGSTLARLVGMGALGYVGQAFSYFTALQYASAGTVALLLYLYPMFVAVLSAIFLKERLTRLKMLTLILALIGTALTVGPQGGQWRGIVLAIGAAAIYSVYIIVGAQVMRRVSAIQSSTLIFASAGAMSGALMVINGPHWPNGDAGWAALVAIVLIATILPVVTFLAGLARIGPTNAAMLSTLEPVVTVALAAVFLQEALPPITLLGGALILSAVLLLARAELRSGVVSR